MFSKLTNNRRHSALSRGCHQTIRLLDCSDCKASHEGTGLCDRGLQIVQRAGLFASGLLFLVSYRLRIVLFALETIDRNAHRCEQSQNRECDLCLDGKRESLRSLILGILHDSICLSWRLSISGIGDSWSSRLSVYRDLWDRCYNTLYTVHFRIFQLPRIRDHLDNEWVSLSLEQYSTSV